MAQTREERLATNEAQFRAANEQLPDAPFENPQFFCECSDRDCVEFVRLPHAEYRAIHEDPMLFVLCPGHEVPDAETVVDRHDGYLVVRKHEDVRHVVD